MKYNKFIIFDTETTGLDGKKNDIIELGFICFTLKKENEKLSFDITHSETILIKVPYSIPEKITEITHITDEMLQEQGVSCLEAYNRFIKHYTKDTLLLSYNYQFDSWFLETFIKTFEPDFILDNDFIDVLTVAKDFLDYPVKLKDVIEKLGLTENVVNSHRAIDDSLAALHTFVKLEEVIKQKNEQYDVFDFINVLGENHKYPISDEYRRQNATYYLQYWNKQDVITQIHKKKTV